MRDASEGAKLKLLYFKEIDRFISFPAIGNVGKYSGSEVVFVDRFPVSRPCEEG